ncbi:MAG TPA: hypothetical protein PK611_01755 [Saprospiraceae bacterium]|nr:hypothetical protein [Saprospiraceae bacterium]
MEIKIPVPDKTTDVVTASENTSQPLSPPVKSETNKSELNIFKKTSLEALRADIRKQEKIKAASRKILSVENIQKIWNEYIEATTSKSVQAALQLAKLSIDGFIIQITVPNQVNKDMVLQETNLLDRLRDDLALPELVFNVQTDISQFPDYQENKFVPTLSQKDKYLQMLEKNPDLRLLTQKLGLKIDH